MACTSPLYVRRVRVGQTITNATPSTGIIIIILIIVMLTIKVLAAEMNQFSSEPVPLLLLVPEPGGAGQQQLTSEWPEERSIVARFLSRDFSVAYSGPAPEHGIL